MNPAAFFEFVLMMVMMVGRQIPYLIQFGRLRAKAHQTVIRFSRETHHALLHQNQMRFSVKKPIYI